MRRLRGESAYAKQRDQMVNKQLVGHGIRDPRVLAAFRQVPRDMFVSIGLRNFAYADSPLPIGHKQTISQPLVIARALEALCLDEYAVVLEVGTGSGYVAALLSQIAAEVYSIERLQELADEARGRISRLGFENVQVRCSDGTLGWPEHAPYDGIAVSASSPEVPLPLLGQLAIGGRLVIPLGSMASQELTQVTRVGDKELKQKSLGQARFVPLIGAKAWPEGGASPLGSHEG